jgi:hypothetical protein
MLAMVSDDVPPLAMRCASHRLPTSSSRAFFSPVTWMVSNSSLNLNRTSERRASRLT